MRGPKLSDAQIWQLLCEEVGATGQARVTNESLYIQRNIKDDWQFWGVVADPTTAKQTIHEFFTS